LNSSANNIFLYIEKVSVMYLIIDTNNYLQLYKCNLYIHLKTNKKNKLIVSGKLYIGIIATINVLS
jgi:hypothetical protein